MTSIRSFVARFVLRVRIHLPSDVEFVWSIYFCFCFPAKPAQELKAEKLDLMDELYGEDSTPKPPEQEAALKRRVYARLVAHVSSL